MTTSKDMKQKLEKLIEVEGDKYVFESSKYSGYPEHMNTFKSGANLLLPMLVDACNTLELLSKH